MIDYLLSSKTKWKLEKKDNDLLPAFEIESGSNKFSVPLWDYEINNLEYNCETILNLIKIWRAENQNDL